MPFAEWPFPRYATPALIAMSTASLNARDVRTAYNVLHQYRQLAEAMLKVPGTAVPWITSSLEDVAAHFKYYAQLAHGMGLSFVAETAAYDLCALCEIARSRLSTGRSRSPG